MFNGYDREQMTRECPFASIPIYLNKEQKDTLTIPGARVTHVCCTGDGGFSAGHVAACAHIPFSETVELMQLVIGGIRCRETGGVEVRLSEHSKKGE